MEARQFIRNAYIECVKNLVVENKRFDNPALHNYYVSSDKHPDCFWYCVDVCWSKLPDPELHYIRCLYQMTLIGCSETDSKLESTIRERLFNYTKENVSNWDDQINRFLIEIKQTEINDEFWWHGCA